MAVGPLRAIAVAIVYRGKPLRAMARAVAYHGNAVDDP